MGSFKGIWSNIWEFFLCVDVHFCFQHGQIWPTEQYGGLQIPHFSGPVLKLDFKPHFPQYLPFVIGHLQPHWLPPAGRSQNWKVLECFDTVWRSKCRTIAIGSLLQTHPPKAKMWPMNEQFLSNSNSNSKTPSYIIAFLCFNITLYSHLKAYKAKLFLLLLARCWLIVKSEVNKRSGTSWRCGGDILRRQVLVWLLSKHTCQGSSLPGSRWIFPAVHQRQKYLVGLFDSNWWSLRNHFFLSLPWSREPNLFHSTPIYSTRIKTAKKLILDHVQWMNYNYWIELIYVSCASEINVRHFLCKFVFI